ncbi:MAG: hypothetical protein OXN84_18275, partial [Albidovulum sp.]|nr:hypothetical protein [Albidovulum sp.]
MSSHADEIPDRGRRPTILIRKAWRKGGMLRKKAVGDITCMPVPTVAGIRAVVRRGAAFESPGDAFAIRRSPAAWNGIRAEGSSRSRSRSRRDTKRRSPEESDW